MLRQYTKKREGFTLIEVMLYVGLTSFLLLAAVSLFSLLIQARVKHQTISEVESQGLSVMQHITEAIRSAESIQSPAAGSSDGSLSLDAAGLMHDPIVFDLSDGVIRMAEGGSAPIALHNARITASALTFQNTSRTDTPGIIRVVFTLRHNNFVGRNEYSFEKTFQTSVALRYP